MEQVTHITHIWSRQWGKRAALQKWIDENIALGNKIAVHTKDGLFCAKCDKPWLECYGECFEKTTDKNSAEDSQ